MPPLRARGGFSNRDAAQSPCKSVGAHQLRTSSVARQDADPDPKAKSQEGAAGRGYWLLTRHTYMTEIEPRWGWQGGSRGVPAAGCPQYITAP